MTERIPSTTFPWLLCDLSPPFLDRFVLLNILWRMWKTSPFFSVMLKSESHEFIFLGITSAAYSDHFNYICNTPLRNSSERFLSPPTPLSSLDPSVEDYCFELQVDHSQGNIKGVTDVSFLWVYLQSIVFCFLFLTPSLMLLSQGG